MTAPGVNVAVLASARDVVVAGGTVGFAVARACRAGAAVVCVWTGDECMPSAMSAPATAAANRLADGLRRRGHTVRASRRLVFVALPAQEAAAAAEADRAAAVAGAAPVVLALGGARGIGFDAALRASEVVVVASHCGSNPALASLAIAGVESLGAHAVACDVPAVPSARLMAALGLGLAPGARAGLSPALEALR